MKKVEISYNPYKMTTTMSIDGVDVCKDRHYEKFREFIENGIPLQTWIEPIDYMDWEGFVNEISDPEINDEVEIIFSGRAIDFEDLQRSIAAQNQNDNRKHPVIYHYEHREILDDQVLSANIEDVVKELKSDRFQTLVAQQSTEALSQKYNDLDKNYATIKERVFDIVFAGAFSSGKSTLLNALIRHDVLPMSDRTCTSKNCRIRHDRSLERKLSLTCYDKNGEVVVEKRIFDQDTDCANAFLEICPIADSSSGNNYPHVETMELGVDLSHLYPSSVTDDKFTIVLTDTPGMNSARSIENGVNKHAETALKAISMKSKPMIILCVEAPKYEDTSIGEFMRKIIAHTGKEGSGFNDRFLFLMNKSDTISYRQNETPDQNRAAFASYLTDSSKWNVGGDEEDLDQLANDASHFIPRVFMTAAAPALAIISHLADIPEQDVDKDHETLRDTYDTFKKKVVIKHREYYYLSRYCDIPNYRKDEIEKEFDAAVNEENDVRATELQCGLIAVESAIKDYIERYAFPIKVRDLLETFEDILVDVSGFTNASAADLLRKRDELGERDGERRGVIREKESVEEKRAALEEAREKSKAQLRKLDEIKFDSTSLKKAMVQFENDIEADEEVYFFRSHGNVDTGKSSPDDVMNDIKRRTDHIRGVFETALRKTNEQLEIIKKNHDKQLADIFAVLKDIVEGVERSGVFRQGEYSFKNSVFWRMSFKDIDASNFVSDIKKTVVDRYVGTKEVRNDLKNEWNASGNLFKIIGSWFLPDTITVPDERNGSYETGAIVASFDTYIQNLRAESTAMEKTFSNIMDESKKKVLDLANRLLNEIDRFQQDIKKQSDRIDSLGGDMKKLEEEIKKSEETRAWLSRLAERIKGV